MRAYMENGVLYFEILADQWEESFVGQFENSLKQNSGASMAVFDCGGVEDLSNRHFDQLIDLMELATQLPQGALFLGTAKLVGRVEEAGLHSKLRAIVANSRIKRSQAGPTSANWVFHQAVAQAVESISLVKPEATSLESLIAEFDSEVGGKADFVLGGVSGTWILSIPSDSLVELVSRIMGERQTISSPGLLDWPAEILNMGSAAVKESFAQSKQEIQLAIPKFAQAAELKSIRQAANQLSRQYFKTEIGPFRVEIIMDSQTVSRSNS